MREFYIYPNNTRNNGRFPIGKSTVLLWALAC